MTFVLGISMLINCSPKTKKATLPLAPPQAFSDSGTEALPDRWWTVFGDTTMNALVDSALQSNFNLATAWQRLREAQAIVDRESSSLFPDLNAIFEGELRRPEFDDTERLELGLTSQYEIDLWGRIRSRIEAERYRERATFADYQTAALSLSAEVVRTWYQLIEAQNQLELVEEQIETNENVLNLIEARFGTGQIRSVDILRQRQLLEATREQKIAAESRIQVLQHQLVVLLGRPPQEKIEIVHKDLPELPPLPAMGIPMELVRRRPDVQRAYSQLQAADRDLASAISNQYPRLTLTASASTRGESAGNLFQDFAGSFVGSLLAPLLDAGERGAEVDRTKSVKQQRLYEYGQTILLSFQEVEDALIQEKKQLERIRSLEQQVGFARQSYEQLRIEYFNGVSDYIDVLTALTDEQQLRRDRLSARLVLLEFRIALYRAMAGGFETGTEAEEES
ncbi:TolC family protein [candidate division KSB1 bacterium]|nr:TolC family protein [candidate division KSB1 bacterium]NIS23806.1 TolC family protein [candidate division KSB1 bacterium]